MQGYEKLARFVSANRGIELYRRFGWLQTLNLLYLQAQLTDLEAQLRDTIKEDIESSDQQRLDLMHSWSALERSKEIPGVNLQYNLIMEIRKTLDAYLTALTQRVATVRLGVAPSFDRVSLCQWLDHPDGGDMFFKDLREASPWREENADDLVCVDNHSDIAGLMTKCWYGNILPVYHRFIGRHFKQPSSSSESLNIYVYSDKRFETACKIIGTILAALFPTGSIFALYFINDALVRLGFIMTFTLSFALTLATMTKAILFEIFAASTAFAAIEVVFVSGLGS